MECHGSRQWVSANRALRAAFDSSSVIRGRTIVPSVADGNYLKLIILTNERSAITVGLKIRAPVLSLAMCVTAFNLVKYLRRGTIDHNMHQHLATSVVLQGFTI
jgi:hypothetical protein